MLRYLSRREGVAQRPMKCNPNLRRGHAAPYSRSEEIPTSMEQICNVSALRSHNPLPLQIIHNHIPPNCYPAPPEPDHLTPMPPHHRLPRPPVPLQPIHKQDPLRSPLRPADLLVPC